MTITAAVIGTGFIGTVHIGALRRLGVTVAGVLGSSPDRAAERGQALGLRAYATLDDMLADAAVDVVHVTSPNDLHYSQVKAILAAGKHVICEKPLAMTATESAEMVALARASGKVAAVCYNIRFYPLNQHARGLVASGNLGDIRLITGHYHQDWLAKETDWNWRLVPSAGGTLRSVGDIGTHWLDLVTFIAGERPTHVLADLQTFIPTRQRPTGPVETFSAAAGPTVPERIETDDAAQMLLRFASGARAVFTTSQVSHGRKNSLRWDITASNGSAAWDSETPDHLWLGHRDAPNQILQRDAGLMHPLGGAATSLPPGHTEGFADSFHSFFRAVYADIAKGARSPDATWATFEDGHAEMAFCDAVIHSAKTQSWTAI
jgi:predicted dehydrogenase